MDEYHNGNRRHVRMTELRNALVASVAGLEVQVGRPVVAKVLT